MQRNNKKGLQEFNDDLERRFYEESSAKPTFFTKTSFQRNLSAQEPVAKNPLTAKLIKVTQNYLLKDNPDHTHDTFLQKMKYFFLGRSQQGRDRADANQKRLAKLNDHETLAAIYPQVIGGNINDPEHNKPNLGSSSKLRRLYFNTLCEHFGVINRPYELAHAICVYSGYNDRQINDYVVTAVAAQVVSLSAGGSVAYCESMRINAIESLAKESLKIVNLQEIHAPRPGRS